MQYKRILLKLSGEALMGTKQYGIDAQRLSEYAEEIKEVVDKGIEVAIVIGGGNIFRGLAGAGHRDKWIGPSKCLGIAGSTDQITICHKNK